MSLNQTIDGIYRSHSRRVLATLIRLLGDFDRAEEALHDAFAAAAQQWTEESTPANPYAWLVSAGRFRAIDHIRRRTRFDAAQSDIADSLYPEGEMMEIAENQEIEDDMLRLIFTCCHPALKLEARVALTVKTLGGLTTAQTARAFLVEPRAMERRLTRAKRKILDAGIPYRVPPDELLPERVAGVRSVVYLVFTEGHTASDGDRLVRGELCDEAIRLARLLREALADDAETLGLLALMLLHDARRATRVDSDGHAIALARQDRTRWDGERIAEGLALLDEAIALLAPGAFQVEAAIAALHARAPSFEGTDWPQIAALYDRLARWRPSAVVEVNRAVAIGFAEGPRRGLDHLDTLDADGALAGYVPLHAARAELLRRLGDGAGADAAYGRAIAAAGNAVQRAELEARRAGR